MRRSTSTTDFEIVGVGRDFTNDTLVIDAKGSGLVFRTLSAIACARRAPTILTGDHTLRRRVMKPLFDALASLGANIQHIGDHGKAPVINWDSASRVRTRSCRATSVRNSSLHCCFWHR